MHAVVLAAGAGSRLRDVAPVKPLALFRGRALILHVLDALMAGGATSATVVVGYRADAVAAAAAGHALRPATVVNAVWETTPNGVSLLAARSAIDGPTLLCMADHLLSPGLVARTATAARLPLTLAVDRRLGHPWVDEADVTRVRTERGAIAAIGKALVIYDAYDTGLFVVGPSLVRALAPMAAPSLSEGVAVLAKQGMAGVVDGGDAPWLDVDDARALALAEREWPL
ncbi:phosphocholine cytidylyltransferase family protein [Sandaracinobacteroides saxicola]|uniref:NTP transferase domain-containing protein n=1 Tax=Sandaracinobacteroides saxicola TaxID=2759707 RepID=A0A7G5IEN8_9SPHN|nr:NTP transferase domain-containing protein [Sandaracinobacteroides saxicola]QMW21830.1 NTP transferase domain-containing protein [Sandaracinobacteroides saxicola]